ncbi:hypothetical protein LTR36_005896 [Oleoguttula mirabilis]|uniref:Guanine nucleotide-exchange factor SEC12 n=1 Tax=Oleoguttula mirabilis TaxID=1507867 RepID=A0AAV9JDB2_9PEZI|nr:hypothetical protein LTR36_005896 [Oleoguttula mirabilis]
MVLQPTSKVSFAKTSLPYPLFAADFDPYNRGYLVVGGGGGISKTGVQNQISVLDVSNRSTITTIAEIQLSRDEDSVQSLGSLATKDGLITLAGINSSQADQNAGKNEHLRSFDIKYPPRKKQRTEKSDGVDEKGEIKPIGQRSLFKPSPVAKQETYQRVLRLSPAQKRESGSKRIGAVASSMAKDNEVVVFNATSATPAESDIITRINLPEGAEAADLDILEPEKSEFSVAYCTDSDVYEQTFRYDFSSKKAEKTPKGPRRIYQMPVPDASENTKSRPTFRCLRFLNTENLITLVNKPNKGGAELRIFHLYPTGPASLALQKSLPRRIRQAVGMDVCALDADKSGNQQVVVAVAGRDISIEVYVTNYQRRTATFSPFKHYITLKDVHEHQITKICLSPFHSPIRAADPEPPATGPNGELVPSKALESPSHPGPQYIRMASVTYGNTVVVDTFPLSPLDPKDKQSRYVLSHPSDETMTTVAYIVVISGIVLVAAFLIQSFIVGFSDDKAMSPFNLLPEGVRNFLDQPAAAAGGFGRGVELRVHSVVEDSLPTNIPGVGRLREFLSQHDPASSNKALVVRDAGDSTSLSIDVHPDQEAYIREDTEAKYWDQMNEQQQTAWKEKLIRAGEWVEGQGEKVLFGVLFSEYAGVVGNVAAQAMGG